MARAGERRGGVYEAGGERDGFAGVMLSFEGKGAGRRRGVGARSGVRRAAPACWIRGAQFDVNACARAAFSRLALSPAPSSRGADAVGHCRRSLLPCVGGRVLAGVVSVSLPCAGRAVLKRTCSLVLNVYRRAFDERLPGLVAIRTHVYTGRPAAMLSARASAFVAAPVKSARLQVLIRPGPGTPRNAHVHQQSASKQEQPDGLLLCVSGMEELTRPSVLPARLGKQSLSPQRSR